MLQTISRPLRCISAVRSNHAAFNANPRREDGAPANKESGHHLSPAIRPIVKTTSDTDCAPEETSGSITSSSMESDTTFSEEEDNLEDSKDDSSLPSPELFREERYGTFTLT